ncbi:MAG: cell division protein FtsB [Archangium gephyra]|uniref:Cell division protein FtsB n=1 Tax=Archangium gephyra TaxID=48 RepID=A0A2W5T580_9BACT|nr:MAG: cell division protein FtsB [Archangium gephyra]
MDRRRQVVWGAVAIALMLAAGSLSAEGGFRRYARLKRDLHSLEERNARLRAENERLKLEAHRLKSEPAALERAARESLGLVRPGEVVFNLENP